MGFDAQSAGIMRDYMKTESLEDALYVKGKVAIVTGGNSGLGFCVARRLLQGGAKVVITGRDEEKGIFAVNLLKEHGLNDVAFCKADLRSEQDVQNIVTFTDKTFGSIDILSTCGGVWSYAHVYDLPEEEFQRIVDTNLIGTYRCAKHVSRYMIDHQIKGKIVFTASNSAFLSALAFGGYAHYVASKGGVIAMTQEIGKELKRFGIMVNAVAPGAMLTPGCFSNAAAKGLTEEQEEEILVELTADSYPDIPSADEVALAIYTLCTDVANGITGECLVSDGGMMRNIMSYIPQRNQYPEE